MTPGEGLHCAFTISPGERATPSDWNGIHDWRPGSGVLWVNLDYKHPAARRWLLDESGLPAHAIATLLDEDPRPVVEEREGAVLLVLRGATTEPAGLETELASFRAWTDGHRLISSRHRPIAELAPIEQGDIGRDDTAGAGALLGRLVERVIGGLEPVMEGINDRADDIEGLVLANPAGDLAGQLGTHRRQLLAIHRHLAPQRDALLRLASISAPWLGKREARLLRRTATIANTLLDDLNAARDHAAILQEELEARSSERLNRRIYVFTVIATIFIPLTFLSGLLGANVDGIPFANEQWAFAGVVVACLAIATGQWLLLRRLRLL